MLPLESSKKIEVNYNNADPQIQSAFFQLPSEVILTIFRDLTPSDLAKKLPVCKKWYLLSADHQLQMNMLKKAFPTIKEKEWENIVKMEEHSEENDSLNPIHLYQRIFREMNTHGKQLVDSEGMTYTKIAKYLVC